MALTMVDPASSWFEIVELPLVKRLWTMTINGKELLTLEETFDNKFWQNSKINKQNLVE